MFEALYPWMHLVGRILFALVFIVGGVSHFTTTSAMVGYAQRRGVPAPKIAVQVSGAVIVVSGVLVALGWHRFIAAGLLFLFLLGRSFLIHTFWKETDPAAKTNEMALFQKDLALAGAALVLAFYAGWPWPMSMGG